jgi:hypothetical protein
LKRLCAAWLLCGLVGVAARAGEDAVSSGMATITSAKLARHIATLASDEFEGREPGTEGERKTLAYLEREFAAAGAAPANGRSYLQRVPMIEVTRSGRSVCVVHAASGDRVFEPDAEFIATAGAPATRVTIAAAPVVFAGHGVEADEYGWNDYAGSDVRDAVVVVLRQEPFAAGDTTFFRGRELTVHGTSGHKFELAARRGARAVIVVHTDASAGYPWSTLSGGGLGTTQLFLAAKSKVPQLDAVVHVSEPAARALFAQAGFDFDALVASAGRRDFRAVATGLTVDIELTARTRRITSHNVVARIRGREAPNECIVYTAHWDHVGRNPSLDGDQIFNGAVDNATGTAALLELAAAFASLGAPPRRSVYFVATTAEEKGLLGAEYYALHPLRPLRDTAAVLNLDAHFPYGSYAAMTTPGLGLSELDEVMARAAARIGRTLQPDGMPEVGAFYRNDTYPFVKRGVPSIFSVGGPRADEPEDSPVNRALADYGRAKYHKPGDEYDAATWDLRGIEEDVRVYFAAGFDLADDTRFPNWRFETEFRRLRDDMRGRGSSRR